MMSKVEITDIGDANYLPGDFVDRLQLRQVNEALLEKGKEPGKFKEILMGITKASLNTESFLSMASFQHTIKVLAGAAIAGATDNLHGLKENVILGKLIPAGTGLLAQKEQALAESEDALDGDPLVEEPLAAEALGIGSEPGPVPASAD